MDEKKFSSVNAVHLTAMNILARKGLLCVLLKTRRDIGPTNRHKILSTLKEEAPLSVLIYMRS